MQCKLWRVLSDNAVDPSLRCRISGRFPIHGCGGRVAKAARVIFGFLKERMNSSPKKKPSYPAHAGYPVRPALSLDHWLLLECWIARMLFGPGTWLTPVRTH